MSWVVTTQARGMTVRAAGQDQGETVRHRQAAADPDGDDVQLGRIRRETARHREAAGHRLLSLVAAREGIGHVIFHQAPRHDRPPLPTRPVSEFLTPNSYAEACADEYSAVWRQAIKQNTMDWRAWERLGRCSNQTD